MALSKKELMLIQDNIKMTQNCISFMQTCSEMATDPQVKGICQSMVREHQGDIQTLMKHVNTTTMQ